MSKNSHKAMRWTGRYSDVDLFRTPDGGEVRVESTGLSMDQAQRIAYKKWQDSKK